VYYLLKFGLVLPGRDNNLLIKDRLCRSQKGEGLDRVPLLLSLSSVWQRGKFCSNLKMGVARLELAHPLRITDFKSVASTIPPHPQVPLLWLEVDRVNVSQMANISQIIDRCKHQHFQIQKSMRSCQLD
jgi:hypothetical protein